MMVSEFINLLVSLLVQSVSRGTSFGTSLKFTVALWISEVLLLCRSLLLDQTSSTFDNLRQGCLIDNIYSPFLGSLQHSSAMDTCAVDYDFSLTCETC